MSDQSYDPIKAGFPAGTNVELVCKLYDVVHGQKFAKRKEITYKSSFKNDLGADSLDIVELLIEVENVFGIYIPTEHDEELTTFGKMAEYVSNIVSRKTK